MTRAERASRKRHAKKQHARAAAPTTVQLATPWAIDQIVRMAVTDGLAPGEVFLVVDSSTEETRVALYRKPKLERALLSVSPGLYRNGLCDLVEMPAVGNSVRVLLYSGDEWQTSYLICPMSNFATCAGGVA